MPYEARVLLALALIVIVSLFAVSVLQSWLGKPVRGTLNVPQGKNRIPITLTDDTPLRPFKYDQVFDVTVLPSAHSGSGALAYKDALIGFADDANSYGQHLSELADVYPTVKASAVIVGLDSEGQPIARLNLPNTAWFVRALTHARKAES